MRNIRAAFVGFGEVNTPRDIIVRKCGEARALLEGQGVDIVSTAPVSDDPAGEDVARARKELAGKDFDLLVLCVAGWIPSHAVLGVAEPFRHKPMLLWGLTGWQEGGRFVTTADQAGTTALRKPLEDMAFRFKYVPSYMGQPLPAESVMAFARAARAEALLRDARIGFMGYRDMRLYATVHDAVSLKAKIGPEIEIFDTLEMAQAMEKLDAAEVSRLSAEVKGRWEFAKEPKDGTVENAVKLFLALRGKIRANGYEAISLVDVDGVKKLLNFAPAGVFMLLHEEEGVCTVPENDAMGSVTQLMVKYLTGQAAAYMEFYEFLPDGVLMGVPDYVPTEIVDGPVRVMPTAFGQFGEGLLNVSKVKTGRVTLARLTYRGDRYAMHVVGGQAEPPPAWEEAGWEPPAPQLPSLQIRLDEPMETFAQKVLGQHYILSYGDNRAAFADLCKLLGVDVM